jgi:endonuclease/exonuclease/phosphatase family metal-dependent hydrolase
VVTFNLHNGFDERGGYSLDRMLDELAAVDADVIALQEVSRGWVINGGADLFELIRTRLGMAAVWGPSVGGDWGNAILAKVPPREILRRSLPPAGLPLPRSVLEVAVPFGPAGSLRVFATHLHHVGAHEEIRDEQSRFLARTLPDGGPAVLLGDFNALPTDRCFEILAGAGWRDVHAPDAPAAPTYPSRAPVRRIDTILVRGPIETVGARVAPPWGSDHRAVRAEIRRAGPVESR